MKKLTVVQGEVADYIRRHPEKSYRAISEMLRCSLTTVASIARKAGIVRKPRLLNEQSLIGLENN
jgi:hypothetical protein